LYKHLGKRFVEPFCGSAVISANLSSEGCILVDNDPYLCEVLSRFDELLVPEVFSVKDYLEKRTAKDWWKWSYCLMSMSFAGEFKHDANKFNASPDHKDRKPKRLRAQYLRALRRWKQLKPKVICSSYQDVEKYIKKTDVLVIDPPYEGANVCYNKGFDHTTYAAWITRILNEKPCENIITFNLQQNMNSVAVSRTFCNQANDSWTDCMFEVGDPIEWL
jgi:site-specific DNA-adenine methylase